MLTGFHHVTLRVSDLGRAREFYSALPGFVLDQDFPDLGKLRFRVGEARMRLVLVAPLPEIAAGEPFDESRIGLDHIAIGVEGGLGFLRELEQALLDLGATNSGIGRDRAGRLAMITFRDPDNIQWEFFEDS